jgi:uncharacterized glyoxalase superfamily protein PhnB
MSEHLIAQLEEAIEFARAHPDEQLPPTTAELQPLLSIAGELRYLPREEFRMRLQEELTKVPQHKTAEPLPEFREGFHTVTPYLPVKDVRKLIEFVKEAFGAEGAVQGTGSEGGLHAEFRIGDSMLMMGGGDAWQGTPMPTALHYYVDDVDAVYQRALDAGATSQMAPIENHGERVAGIIDVSGNEWYIAKRLTGSHTDEGLRTVTVYFHPQGAAEMIEFLKRAFGASEEQVHRAQPDGPVLHAKIRIGDSVIEMGEAHGPWQNMPTMLYLYVDDVERWYRRAVEGGAASVNEPADQPYGDRVAAVSDPFGNIWYIATPIRPQNS